jgi:transcription initiation factor IIE alpha subunit
VLDAYYIVRLSWDGVEYREDGTIRLLGARLTNEYLKTLHKLENSDLIIINTEKHEETTHAYHLVYEAQVVNAVKKPYKYQRE